MPLNVACQMDPIDRIDIQGDSTFALLLEAQRRGHKLFYYTPPNLSLLGGRLIARGSTLEVEDKAGAHYRLSDPRTEDLADLRRGAAAPGPAVRHVLHHHHAPARAHPSQDAGGQRPGATCATRPRRCSCSTSST